MSCINSKTITVFNTFLTKIPKNTVKYVKMAKALKRHHLLAIDGQNVSGRNVAVFISHSQGRSDAKEKTAATT
jgi:hypothetical protein